MISPTRAIRSRYRAGICRASISPAAKHRAGPGIKIASTTRFGLVMNYGRRYGMPAFKLLTSATSPSQRPLAHITITPRFLNQPIPRSHVRNALTGAGLQWLWMKNTSIIPGGFMPLCGFLTSPILIIFTLCLRLTSVKWTHHGHVRVAALARISSVKNSMIHWFTRLGFLVGCG